MKLVELATKLEINQSEIITFLRNSEAWVEENPDMDLTDERVAKVKSHFLSARRQRLRTKMKTGISVSSEKQLSPHANNDDKKTAEAMPVQEDEQPSGVPKVQQTDNNSTLPDEEKIMRIETPKIELPGLKVIGKIDLPQPKEKNKETDRKDTAEKEPLPARKKRKYEKERKDKKRKTYRGSTSSSHRHAGQKESQGANVKKGKEQRARHYYQKISRYNAPVAPLRKENASDYEVYQEEKPTEKSLLNKIFGWLAGS